MVRAQVAVVGGGPVGMLVAAELAGYGVDTLVLETRTRVSERPKATTLHARAVQCLARRGHLPPPSERPPRGEACGDFHFAGIPGLVITAPETEPEPILKYPQAELERLFEARARAAGARVLRGHRVTGIGEERDGVRLRVEGPDGPTTYFVEYVVGADGARSTVREQVGIGSDVGQATVSALTGHVTLGDAAAWEPGWRRTPRGWIISKHTPGGGTHIRTLNCASAHEDRQRTPSLEEFRREVSRIAGHDVAMGEPRWISRFSDFTQLARTFRTGRTFLVGDAAHVHFPIGGQGLSTGVLDALNLSWKLALAVRGEAGEGLLDTYDLERRPAAQRVVDNTRAQLALMRPGREVDALRRVFGGLLAADHLKDAISAQDTLYPTYTSRPSPWEGRFLSNARLTTRDGETDVIRLLRDGRPLLLLFGEKAGGYLEEARPWSGTLNAALATQTPGMPYEALLVRPDGYIAWGPGGAGLADALAVYFADRDRAAYLTASTVSLSCDASTASA
ncbi:FAD-dependent monooxygenase [Streptomyces sp. NPDC003042]